MKRFSGIKTTIILVSLATSLLLTTGCSIRVTMSGASIPDNLKKFSVQYFANRAPLINPTLSQNLTEGLKDRIMNESRLTLSRDMGDVDFSGEITGYDTRPMAIKADAISAETRLTVSIKVRCRNFKDPKRNWEATFSAYQDFSSERNLTEVEEELVKIIIEQLTENIFNKAFADW